MRVIKPATVRYWMREHPKAKPGLEWWLETIRHGSWGSLADLRRTFPSAEAVRVASGRRVIVFNIGGNSYRLMAALHFNTGQAYALAFMTHSEYSKDRWKDTL